MSTKLTLKEKRFSRFLELSQRKRIEISRQGVHLRGDRILAGETYSLLLRVGRPVRGGHYVHGLLQANVLWYHNLTRALLLLLRLLLWLLRLRYSGSLLCTLYRCRTSRGCLSEACCWARLDHDLLIRGLHHDGISICSNHRRTCEHNQFYRNK